MPLLLPFRGLRPGPAFAGKLSDVVCPPYDVISDPQRAELLARSPYNMVRIELPKGDYAGAAATLLQWKSSGALVREPEPALYGYRMKYVSPTGEHRETVGVLGALVLEPPGRGILPHEQTTPKDKSDRLELLRATHANTSPIWCLCTEAGLAGLLGDAASGEGEIAEALDDEGVSHEIWPIFDRAVHDRIAVLAAAAPLLVADGHHRYETALAYQAEVGTPHASEPGPCGGAPEPTGPGAILSLVVELSDQYLQVLAIHRGISGLPPGTDVVTAFKEGFSVNAATATGAGLVGEMKTAGAVGLVTREGAYLAKPRPERGSAAFALDSSRVDAALGTLPPHHLSYEHDVARALGEVQDGRLDALALCRPPTVAQIAATARGGERMPPKTTFFWPKPRTGMVLRDW